MLNYDQLKERPRDFLAATDLTQDEFTNLLPVFQTAYETHYPLHPTVEGSARQ